MAEAIIKIGDKGVWRNGDLISIFNDRHIQRIHAQHIVNANPSLLMADWLDATVVNGRVIYSEQTVSDAWDAIEAKTAYSRDDPEFQRITRGTGPDSTLRVHLVLRVDNCSDAQCASYMSEEHDARGVLTRKRIHTSDWSTVLGLTSQMRSRILDRSDLVDLRDTMFLRTVAIRAKLGGEP